MNQKLSLSENLVKALEDLPRFALNYAVGFLIVAITDVSVTTLAVGAILLGIIATPMVAGITFLFAYVLMRILQGIGSSIGWIAQQLHYQAEVEQMKIGQTGLLHNSSNDAEKSL